MAKFKIKHTITKKEWNKKHKDFKSMIDGVPYIMMYDDKTGTHLVPVKIVDESVNEAYVPSNIKDFAKRKGVTQLVNTVAGWAEKVAKGIKGGTAIGKNYNTLILDMSYNGSEIRINCEDETIELYDEPVRNFQQFKKVYNEYQMDESVNEGNFGEIDIMAKAARNFNEFVKEFYKDFRDFPKDKDTLKWLKSLYDGRSAFESVNEMDINDPIMMKLRAAQMKRNQDAAKKVEKEKKINPDYKALKNATKIKALKKKRAEVMRDMEQEAEPEGGKIANRYGDLLNKIDNDIIKLGGNPMGESINENDGVYFKSYTAAIEAARAAALKKGFEVDDDEMFTKVGMNSKRPSVGKTTRVSLELTKAGKPQRKMLHIQVYGMKNGYELNSYIN